MRLLYGPQPNDAASGFVRTTCCGIMFIIYISIDLK